MQQPTSSSQRKQTVTLECTPWCEFYTLCNTDAYICMLYLFKSNVQTLHRAKRDKQKHKLMPHLKTRSYGRGECKNEEEKIEKQNGGMKRRGEERREIKRKGMSRRWEEWKGEEWRGKNWIGEDRNKDEWKGEKWRWEKSHYLRERLPSCHGELICAGLLAATLHMQACVCVSQRLCHSLAEALLEDSWITNVWEFGRFSAHAVHSECD